VGVPQGSILGPILFLLLINDLAVLQANDQVHPVLYADDSTLLCSSNTLTSAGIVANRALAKLELWCKQNKMFVNTDKTKLMTFGFMQSPLPLITLIIVTLIMFAALKFWE